MNAPGERAPRRRWSWRGGLGPGWGSAHGWRWSLRSSRGWGRMAVLARTHWVASASVVILLAGIVTLTATTRNSMRAFPDDLESLSGTAVKSQILARDGTPLSFTLENSWNTTDVVPLGKIPPLLQTAFIVAEDQHYYQHHGVDWPARFAALTLDVRERAA